MQTILVRPVHNFFSSVCLLFCFLFAKYLVHNIFPTQQYLRLFQDWDILECFLFCIQMLLYYYNSIKSTLEILLMLILKGQRTIRTQVPSVSMSLSLFREFSEHREESILWKNHPFFNQMRCFVSGSLCFSLST